MNQIYAQKILSEITNQNTVFTNHKPLQATKIIFNGPATIVFWSDGTKTVVKCNECCKDNCLGTEGCEYYTKEIGIAYAFAKKAFGNDFYKAIRKYGQERL